MPSPSGELSAVLATVSRSLPRLRAILGHHTRVMWIKGGDLLVKRKKYQQAAYVIALFVEERGGCRYDGYRASSRKASMSATLLAGNPTFLHFETACLVMPKCRARSEIDALRRISLTLNSIHSSLLMVRFSHIQFACATPSCILVVHDNETIELVMHRRWLLLPESMSEAGNLR